MATLTSVNVVPITNIAGAQTTYDFFFTTATTGTIKIIEINFTSIIPPGIDPSSAILIESSGIGSGSLSGSFNPATGLSKLTHTVSNLLSITAGTPIRLEVARLIANPGTWFAKITTKGTAGNIIDGPTQSPNFSIIQV